MPARQEIDPHLLAIEINALRVAEIATLRRECAFWRERCLLLETLVDLPAHPGATVPPRLTPPPPSAEGP
jgi:hypothetical protein